MAPDPDVVPLSERPSPSDRNLPRPFDSQGAVWLDPKHLNLIAEMSVLSVYLRMGISEVLADIIERRAKELGVGVLQASEEPSTEPVLACDDLAQYLQPLVLNEPPRINEYGSVSSVCTTLEAMLADLEELKTDTRHAGHYAFSGAALEAGLGFLFVRQWTGQKSAWTQAINLANTINCDYKADFPRATELIPAFAAHLKATATAKNPKAGLKSWKAADQEAHRELSADIAPAQSLSETTDDMVGRLV